ncbi:MAG: hypothetical protein P1U50_11030 [Parvibaculaceae bacterium]|nr:hypothetical protein [Parvibaculaceae bacterium]
MANLSEETVWEEGIYQLETTDPVLGGPDGIDNRQAKELANRTQYLKAQTDLRAPIESPAFTGNPTALTQALGTNNTTLATTAFIQAAISALVASSPGTLDTLNELAAALGDDPNFAATVTALIATKLDASVYNANDILAKLVTVHGTGSGLDADKLNGHAGSYYAPTASPALTGTPTAPTAGAGNATTQIANTEFVQTEISNGLGDIDLSLYAPKVSPALTGNPTAPTQTPGTNNTTLATTAFTQAAIAALVASSPGTLDTLNELAAALGDDPNFATTMTTLIGTKLNASAFTGAAILSLLLSVDGVGSGLDADKLDGVQGSSYARKASPALTGDPTAPTQPAGNNSTRLATTAYAERAVQEFVNNSKSAALVKAWVSFDGTGVVSIRDSYNVSSITDNGAGNYTLNFAAGTFVNTNYAWVGTAQTSADSAHQGIMVVRRPSFTKTVNALQIVTVRSFANTTGDIDSADINVQIFGGN